MKSVQALWVTLTVVLALLSQSPIAAAQAVINQTGKETIESYDSATERLTISVEYSYQWQPTSAHRNFVVPLNLIGNPSFSWTGTGACAFVPPIPSRTIRCPGGITGFKIAYRYWKQVNATEDGKEAFTYLSGFERQPGLTQNATYDLFYPPSWTLDEEIPPRPTPNVDDPGHLRWVLQNKNSFTAQVRFQLRSCAFINPVNPTRDQPKDSDDFFLRELTVLQPDGRPIPEMIDLYFRILSETSKITAASISVRDAAGKEVHTITLAPKIGDNQHVTWNGKIGGGAGQFLDTPTLQFVLRVAVNGQVCQSEPHIVTDLVWKHRPVVYLHPQERSGPISATFMMKNSTLRDSGQFPDALVTVNPTFSDLQQFNAEKFYMDLDDNKREPGLSEPGVIYHIANADTPNFVFLQYWMFESSSYSPVLPFPPFGQNLCHEGDWEMFQFTVKLNSDEPVPAKKLQPYSGTASQHFYGQTLRWEAKEIVQLPDQAHIEKVGDRPVIYIALKAHATYFRTGNIRVATGKGIPGTQVQYQAVDLATDIYDITSRVFPPYQYTLIHLRGELGDKNSLVETWKGRWGEDELDQVVCDEIRSPLFRGTGTNENDKDFINLLTESERFHNAYLKSTQGCLRIPPSSQCP